MERTVLVAEDDSDILNLLIYRCKNIIVIWQSW